MEKLNPLDMAGQIGYELYGEIGKTAFEELELAFASRLQPRFVNNPKLRTWQNVSFYWSKGYFKNTIMEDFQEVLPAELANRKIVSTSTEKMFGSITDDGNHLVRPLFYQQMVVFIPELLAFLGQGEQFRDKMNILNEALEGKEVKRDLIKFAKASDDLISKYEHGVEGLYFDGNTLSYTPNTCFCIGTRPLDGKTFAALEGSGFWNRFHTITFNITDKICSDIFTGSLTPNGEDSPITDQKQQLKSCNSSLMKQTLPNQCPDYESILKPVLQEADKVAATLCEKYSMDKKDIGSPRVKGDIIREVNAYRILTQASDDEIVKWAGKRLGHFFSFIAKPELASVQRVQYQTRLNSCLAEIKAAFSGQKGLPRETIICKMQEKAFSRATIDRALSTLVKADYGKYDVE